MCTVAQNAFLANNLPASSFDGYAEVFFHIDRARPHSDIEGEHHPDDVGAWRAAVRLTRDIESDRWRLEVREGDTRLAYVIIAAHRRR